MPISLLTVKFARYVQKVLFPVSMSPITIVLDLSNSKIASVASLHEVGMVLPLASTWLPCSPNEQSNSESSDMNIGTCFSSPTTIFFPVSTGAPKTVAVPSTSFADAGPEISNVFPELTFRIGNTFHAEHEEVDLT